MNDYSLPQEQLKRLRLAHRLERSKKKADRLKSVYLLGKGWSVAAVSEALLIDENTIYRYFSTYQSTGIAGLLKDNYKGSEEKLSCTELTELEDYLGNCPPRTTIEVIDYVKREFEVEYSISGMNSLLKRLGFVYKKPRPVPGKSDAVKQLEFIKIYEKVREEMTAEDSLFFMDGVHPQHNPIVQYGWFKKGSRYPLKTNTRYHRINITGAVDIDSLDVICLESEKLDEDSTLEFLEKLRKKRPRGWIYVVLDNAGYYNTERIRSFSAAIGIKLLYLPPYSPNLNLVERLWGKMKKEILYNRYYPTFGEFRDDCLSYLRGLWRKKNQLRTLLTEKFEKLPA